MKRRNPSFGCPKITEQISKTFALPLDKDVVRRILTAYYQPERGDGPSWLTFLGHMKDSLWSIDFFRCESLRLKTHWALVVMDQGTRRIIGFGVHQWKPNLRILGIHEVTTLPCVPVSHPFIERLIGAIRREYLDHMLFWDESDLERK